jgi:hypothetical protein
VLRAARGRAALVFAKLYFPSSDPMTGTLQAFAVFARPIGAAIFGDYGDRIGRKVALIATLLLTGLSTFLVGWVPTNAQIGLWGPVFASEIPIPAARKQGHRSDADDRTTKDVEHDRVARSGRREQCRRDRCRAGAAKRNPPGMADCSRPTRRRRGNRAALGRARRSS